VTWKPAAWAEPDRRRHERLDRFSLAAQLYRSARQPGATIGKTIDCLIAAPCVRTGASLLHADAAFDRLASCTPLKVFR
jgi:predicted nucleic acid-binding protein